MDLRDYQIETITRIHAAFGEGCRAVMCQMPTGTGKTVVLASIIREHLGNLLPEGGVLVVAHRREILDQTVETLKRCGLTGELEGGDCSGGGKGEPGGCEENKIQSMISFSR